MRVLVTGAGGYVGRVVVRELLRAGHEPVGFARRAGPGADGVYWRHGDILDIETVRAAVAGVDAVVHLAAAAGVRTAFREPVRHYRVNVGGTVTLLESLMARGGRPCRFVLASTVGVYGTPRRCPTAESSPLDPQNPYAASKVAAEQVVGWQAATGALGAVTLRIGNVAGAVGAHRDVLDSRIIARACAVAAGRVPHLEVFGDGGAVRDFVHVGDVARAFVLALDGCEPGRHEAVNIGAIAASVGDIVTMTRDVTRREVPVSYHAARAGEVRELRADVTRAHELLGWRSRVSDLRRIIADQWHAERGAGDPEPAAARAAAPGAAR